MRCPPIQQRVTNEAGEPGLRLNLHPGQRQALDSPARIVAVIAGGRSGKTVLGPIWLHQQMLDKGPGDYLIAAPNYPLLDKAAGPEIDAYFGSLLGLGTLRRSPMQFVFSPAGCKRLWGHVPDRQPRILFSHATDPDTLEAMSAKAAWLDEAGQAKFRLASWEAVQQRLSVDQGRALITTKPYTLGWLYSRVYQPWLAAQKAGQAHPEIDVINFGSAANPAFPREELARARAALPPWKYLMHYMGQFQRPAGLIYGCFGPAAHVVDDFKLPPDWLRYGGLDFGGTNTAGILVARRPRDEAYFVYSEYHAGHMTARQHAEALGRQLRFSWSPASGEREPRCQKWVGGSWSEDHWRREFAAAGLAVHPPPINDVHVGIGRVYAMIQTGRLYIMRRCKHLIDDLQSYAYVVDDEGNPLEEIDDKASWHRLDALRYLCAELEPKGHKSKSVPGVYEQGTALYGLKGRGRSRR